MKVGYRDTDKIERLRRIFDDNYRVTRLYAAYLESYPELISEDMIKTLCEDGEISREDAIVAILSEAFGLDYEALDDRRIIREYITPAIRIFDKSRYTENPYCKNVKIKDIRLGDFEYKSEYYPPYRMAIADELTICEDFREIPPLCFFDGGFEFPAVLEGGNEWMTLTPVDVDTCTEAINEAHGKVVTFGLGLGYYAYMVSRKSEVQSITVIERSDEAIALFERYILPQFEHPEKVRIIKSDAFAYAKEEMPKEKYDVAFVDIWRDGSDGAEAYRRMRPLEKLSAGTKFIYWIENFIISRLRYQKFEQMWQQYLNGKPLTYEDFYKALTDKDELIK